MSGGRFNYQDSMLKTEIFGWSDKPINVFEDREISALVFDVFDLIHDFDWYKSGDTSEEVWQKKKSIFKKKWFGSRSARLKSIINESIEELRKELYDTIGESIE